LREQHQNPCHDQAGIHGADNHRRVAKESRH
jgi:hypothetical protein